MKLKLIKISVKSFIFIFSTINVVAGFMVGAVVTVVSLVSPDDQMAGGVGVWAILIFPFLNGILGAVAGTLLTGLFNFLASRFGGLELEFEAVQ